MQFNKTVLKKIKYSFIKKILRVMREDFFKRNYRFFFFVAAFFFFGAAFFFAAFFFVAICVVVRELKCLISDMLLR